MSQAPERDYRTHPETFEEEVERKRPERYNQPEECSFCGSETTELKNYSRNYGGNVGGHWLCRFCEVTRSASAQGAGLRWQEWHYVVQDVASMLNILTKETP